MQSQEGKIVTGYAKMWPRTVFNIKEGNRLLAQLGELLGAPGVYVLYRDDQPYYVGKSTRLVKRIWQHANKPKDRYYNFWNYFSAFVVPDQRHIGEIEGVLIASMPTENSSVRRIKRIHLPTKVARFIHNQRFLPMP